MHLKPAKTKRKNTQSKKAESKSSKENLRLNVIANIRTDRWTQDIEHKELQDTLSNLLYVKCHKSFIVPGAPGIKGDCPHECQVQKKSEQLKFIRC